jgi:type I restriction enzyme M protein
LKILEKYINRKDEEFFARHVSHTEIAENEFSLSVTSYVIAEDKRELVEIGELNNNIDVTVKHQETLRKRIDEIINVLEGSPK